MCSDSWCRLLEYNKDQSAIHTNSAFLLERANVDFWTYGILVSKVCFLGAIMYRYCRAKSNFYQGTRTVRTSYLRKISHILQSRPVSRAKTQLVVEGVWVADLLDFSRVPDGEWNAHWMYLSSTSSKIQDYIKTCNFGTYGTNHIICEGKQTFEIPYLQV